MVILTKEFAEWKEIPMSNLRNQPWRYRDRSRATTAMWAVLVLVVVAATGYFGHMIGVRHGEQRVQAAVDQANARLDELTKKYTGQIDELQAKVNELTPPPGPDPATPPPHDAVFYGKALKDKVEAAKTPEDKENTFWGSVCTTQRELVGAPVSVFDGARADTYREFVRTVDPYYYTLVVDKKVSFHTDSMLELGLHELQKQRELEVNACP